MGTLTADGLTIRRLPEILDSIVASERELIDANISTEDDEFLGQMNNVVGLPISSNEELAQAVYDAFVPSRAEGVSLDNIAALTGITRIAGTKSSTTQQLCCGDDGVSIPAGAIIENPINKDRFSFVDEVSLDTSACYSSRYSVKELLNLTLYTLNINGNLVSYTSDASATELEILNGLKANNDLLYTTGNWTVVVDVPNLQLLITTSTSFTISISSITYIGVDEVCVLGNAESIVEGSVIAPLNSINSIVTSVSGWNTTTNIASYTLGRSREIDEELRSRLLISQQISGRGTVEAIQDSLTNVSGVIGATVTENDQSITVGSLPPKSFESVVQGGTDADVALTIWESKPAGIETYGTSFAVVADSRGVDRTVYFTRPSSIALNVEIEYQLNLEETAPSTIDIETAFSNATVAYINALGVGIDVVPSKLYSVLYGSITGGVVITLIQMERQDTPGFSTSKLSIESDEFAFVSSGNITVTEV